MTIRGAWILAFLFALVALAPFGCGGKSSGGSSPPTDGAVLFGQSCVPCHDTDGGDIMDPTGAGIEDAIVDPATGMGALAGVFSNKEIDAISFYLTTGEHSDDWRDEDNHGDYADEEGVDACETCHGGPALTGNPPANSCFQCHGRKW